MKNNGNKNPFKELFWIVFFVVVIIGALGVTSGDYKKLWETGLVTQGVAVRTNDQVQKTIGDLITGNGYYIVELQFEIDGVEYNMPNQKFDVKMFDQLDADDQNGQVPVEIRYEMKDNEPRYIYQGAVLFNSMVIGK